MDLHLDATPEELQVFRAETDELLQQLDDGLMRLERDGSSPALLQDIFRAAHTIKGSSASIGHTRMASLTHAMETLFDLFRNGQISPTPEAIQDLFEALDALRVLAAEVENGEQAGFDVQRLIDALEDCASPVGQGQSPGQSVRSSRFRTPAEATHHLLLEFDAGPWTSVRALQVLLGLEGIASVLASHPSREEVEEQQINQRMEIWLHSDESDDTIQATVLDVPETTVLSFEHAEGEPESEVGEPTDAGGAGTSLPEAPGASGRATTTVRIDVDRLDQLLNLVGELVIDRTRLLQLDRALRERYGDEKLLGDLGEVTLHVGRITDELQAEVMKVRMLPIGTVFSRFPRVVRDLATRQQKRVDLVVQGQETELDRSVIEAIGDPLVHLLRNAVDHGVEPVEEREQRGKPAAATIRLTAEHIESSILVSVEDDGRGIDTDRIRARAVERELLGAEAAARLSESEAVRLIFAPGFSTTEAVSDISGRGVGMDIVRTNVERLGGAVDVKTKVGKGTRFELRLPLTLAIVQALLVRVGQGIFAIPLSAVTETLRVPGAEIQSVQRREAILLRGRMLPIASMAGAFGIPRSSDRQASVLIVAVRVGSQQVGLVVDELLGEQEVVIKALGPVFGTVPGISSAAVLGDGTVALILDVPGLVQRLETANHEGAREDEHLSAIAAPARSGR